jgi:hypothetical protein
MGPQEEGVVRPDPMSALGHKQTFALQNVMSALPPIATLIAYFGMLAKDHKPTKSPSPAVLLVRDFFHPLERLAV